MTNLLAMLVSLAMLLTGVSAAALPDAPVGRVMTIGNLAVSHNDDEIALDVYATLGATTDGVQALFDFSVVDGTGVYFPFQIVATSERLLLKNDKHGQTLTITADELADMTNAALGGDDAENAAINAYISDWLPALMNLMGVMADRSEMEALRARGFEIYDEMVDRGEGVPGRAEYEGEIYDVNTYEYTLTGAQLGALADAIYASSDRLKSFPEAYFKLLAQLPDELGLSGATSYETLLAKLDIGMTASESIADNGLVLLDATLTVNQPNDGPTIRYAIHQARFEDDEFSTVAFDLPADAMALSVYMEYSRDGADDHYSLNITGDSADAEAGEDGEGDGEDALYITLDSDTTRDPDTGWTTLDINATLDAVGGYHGEFSVESEHDSEGMGFSHVACSAIAQAESYSASFDVVVTNEVIEARVSDEGATGVSAFDLMTLLAAIQADAGQLSANADVKALSELFVRSDAEPADDESAVSDDAANSDLPFAQPRFDWLPEGYAVEDISVDTQYADVSCTLVNAKTGGVIIVDLTNTSYVEDGMHYYVVKDDSFKAVDGLLIAEEDCDDYYLYTADDGKISYTIYPDSKDVTTTDVLNLIIGLHF